MVSTKAVWNSGSPNQQLTAFPTSSQAFTCLGHFLCRKLRFESQAVKPFGVRRFRLPPIPLSFLLFLDCHKETIWLQHFESELKMTTEEAALHFLNDQKNLHGLKHFSHTWLENRNSGIMWEAATRNSFHRVFHSPKHCSALRESTWIGVTSPNLASYFIIKI